MNLLDGYSTDVAFDPAEDHIGPFYYKVADGKLKYAFLATQQHCNEHGMVHGGVLMTFADYCLCMEATNHYQDENCVTVSFNCEFVWGGQMGDLIESTAEIIRQTGSMTFVRGQVFSGEDTILTYSSVVKRLRNPD